jgi:predicted molibdopterin-dependent oxidoreductase YjgC
MINSERRIGLVKKVARAPGQAMSDFSIFRLVAQYWGCGEMFAGWNSPEAVFQIIKRLSAGQPCDITGIRDYAHLEAAGGIQWPLSAGATGAYNRSATACESAPPADEAGPFRSERRLFANGQFFHEDGKARFLFDSPRAVAEPVDEEFPLVLLTGRGTSAQWHTNTRTGKSAVLRTLYPANPYVELNSEDAARLGVAPGSGVAIVSRRARVRCMAFVTDTVKTGQVFMPMHYEVTNQLTRAEFDPHSRQPSYKHCAVRVERV